MPSDADRFELSVKIRDETALNERTGTGVAASASVNTDNDDTRYELSWKHSGERWFNEMYLTYEDAFFIPHVVNGDQNGAVYTFNDGQDRNIIAIDGSDPRAGQNKGQKGWGIGNNITFTDIGWITGDHTIKLGVKYKDVDLTAQDSVPGRPVFYYNVTAAGAATDPWKAVFALPLAGFDSSVTSTDQQLGVFVQDDWAGQRSPDAEPGNPLGHRVERVVPGLPGAAVPAGFAQYRDLAGAHLRPVARPVFRSQYRLRHQRLPQHRQQSRPQRGRIPAAPGILLRHRRRPALRDLRRRRPCL